MVRVHMCVRLFRYHQETVMICVWAKVRVATMVETDLEVVDLQLKVLD